MGEPLWLAQVPAPNLPPPPPRRGWDLVVVGAGIVGTSVAWHLRRRGWEVLVLEAGPRPAWGASGRNAGMLLTGLGEDYPRCVAGMGRAWAREVWGLTQVNRDELLAHAARLGVPARRTGSYRLATLPHEARELEEAAELLSRDGFRVRFHDRDPLDRGFRAALEYEGDGTVQPAALVQALLEEAQAPVALETRVLGVERDGGDGVRIATSRGILRARGVALCVNAHAPRLFPHLFADLVRPVRGQVLATEPLSPLLERPGYAEYGYFYFQQTPDGRLVLGGCRHRFAAQEEGYGLETTRSIQRCLEAFLAAHFPEAAGVPIRHRWAGTMAFSADGLPLVGGLPALPEVFFAVGFTGHGMGLGWWTGGLLARLIAEGGSAWPFDARRLSR